jgi:NAD(P)-dependent dehydrogenase (short-subunit alcohol dehydrogenase family)
MSSPPPASASPASPIALVTGGHSGIGLYASIHLALNGFCVLIASRSASKVADSISQAEEDHPELAGQDRLAHVQLDLTDLQSIRTCAAEVEKTYGRLDVLSTYTLDDISLVGAEMMG